MKYKDPELPLEVRIEDLLSRMTIDEKASQLQYSSPSVERLDVPAYNWWNECLHGVARAGRATVFPQAIGLGATFNSDLAFRMAEAISTEGRAKYHHAVNHEQRGRYHGLTFWTPNVNIFRDPRWGRGQETYGEDPYLTSEIGRAFVRGLQGTDPKYLKSAACAKHFAVHSGPEAKRHEFNAEVSDKDLFETYLPAFKALVDEGVEAVMGAYNRTNGEPCCAHTRLMEEILRGQWNFAGHYVSDCWAIKDFHEGHGVTSSPEESAALALKKGCDVNCGSVYESLMDSVHQGLVTEEDIDRSLRRLLRTRFRLGMFDPPELVPWTDTPMSMVGATGHRELAREVAVQSCVLLKNNGILPISNSMRKIFVSGPAADDSVVLLGNYHGTPDRAVTLLEGITERAGDEHWVVYRQGCGFDSPIRNDTNYAFNEARDHDLVIVGLGISSSIEGEEGDAFASEFKGDRRDIALPEHQLEFLRKVAGTNTPVIVVVTGGAPIDLREVHELADAVVFAWYPGQEGGTALASLLFGDRNFSGRLPITFPKSVDQLPAFEDYSMRGRTYRYMTDAPQYPFGFGLSYSSVTYDALRGRSGESKSRGESFSESSGAWGPVTFDRTAGLDLEVDVRNTSARSVAEVVQVYVALVDNDGSGPVHRLVATRRVALDSGERGVAAERGGAGGRDTAAGRGATGSAGASGTTVRFHLDAGAFSTVEADGRTRLREGAWRVVAGGVSPGSRGQELGASAAVELTVEV